jgi:hypothetical protein
MPVQAHSPSIVLYSASALTTQDRHDITLALEPTQPEISLDGGKQVAKALSASLRELLLRTNSSPQLAIETEIERLDRVQALLPAADGIWNAPLQGGDLTLWTVARYVDVQTADPRLLLRVAVLFYEAKVSFARPSQAALRAVVEAMQATGTPRAAVTLTVLEMVTNGVLAKVLSKLTPHASSHRSAAATLAERRIEHRWIGARAFTDSGKSCGLGDDLTAAEVVETAGHVRRKAANGDMLAYLVAMAHWLGLWLWELLHIELFRPRGTGLIHVADDCTHAVVNLGGVLGDLAQERGGRCKPSRLASSVTQGPPGGNHIARPRRLGASARALARARCSKGTRTTANGSPLHRLAVGATYREG